MSAAKSQAAAHNESQCDVVSQSSSALSQISYEEGFANAEYNAITEEDKARRRKEDQDRKMKEFMDKTKKNAQKKHQNE